MHIFFDAMNKFFVIFAALILLGGNIRPCYAVGQNVDPFYLQRLENGERAFLAGEAASAVEELEVALFGLGGNKELRAKACVYLGLSLYMLKNNEKAAQYLEDAKNILGLDGLNPLLPEESVRLYLNKALIDLNLLEDGDKQSGAGETGVETFPRLKITPTEDTDVARDLENQIESNPHATGPYYELYALYKKNENTNAAKKTLENLVRRNPGEAKGYYLLGRIQYEQKKLKDARKNMEKVVELQTSVSIDEYVLLDAMAYQILILERQGKTERAAALYAQRADRFSSEKTRFLDMNREDRNLFQTIGQSEEAQAEIERLRNQGAPGSRAGQKPAAGEMRSKDDTSRNAESNEKEKTGDLVPLYLVDKPPVLIKKVDPEYPPSAKALGVEGQVVVNALISETGSVVEVVIIEGQAGGFNSSTVKAVMQWKFEPAVKDGVKVKVWKPITITFKRK